MQVTNHPGLEHIKNIQLLKDDEEILDGETFFQFIEEHPEMLHYASQAAECYLNFPPIA